MTVVETIIRFGGSGALLIAMLFLAILLISQPGSDVSFWGIRFKRRYFDVDLLKRLRPTLTRFPESWQFVIDTFSILDSPSICEDELYYPANSCDEITLMQVRQALFEMETKGIANIFRKLFAC